MEATSHHGFIFARKLPETQQTNILLIKGYQSHVAAVPQIKLAVKVVNKVTLHHVAEIVGDILHCKNHHVFAAHGEKGGKTRSVQICV